MGSTLHILRSEPDELLAELIAAISAGENDHVVCLYVDCITASPLDWDRLVRDIFDHQRVICWW